MTPVHFPGNQRLVKICVNISAITHPLRAWLPAHVFGRCCPRVPYVARRDAFAAGRFHQQKDGNPKSRKNACRGYCFTTYLIEIDLYFFPTQKVNGWQNPCGFQSDISNKWNERDLLLVVRPKKAGQNWTWKIPHQELTCPGSGKHVFFGVGLIRWKTLPMLP